MQAFLHNSVNLDQVIVDLIINEGGVTKLAVLKYLTVEDLLRWNTPFVMAQPRIFATAEYGDDIYGSRRRGGRS